MMAPPKTPLLIILSAPSGAGKTTLCKMLLSTFPNELVLSISATTRAPRGTEQNGKEYFFLTEEQFRDQIDRGDFAEWAHVHNRYYGTSKHFIESQFQLGKSVLLDIDVQGAAALKKAYPDRCLLVFIAPPSLEELETRLRNRKTETEEALQIRLQNARDEMRQMGTFDKTIINHKLDAAFEELYQTVIAVLPRIAKK